MTSAITSTFRSNRSRLWSARIVICILVAFVLASAATPDTWAHRVHLTARVEGDTVVVEAKLGGGKKVTGARIEVLDVSGKKILEGRTDDKGVYSFKLADIPNVQGDLRILLREGRGHDTEYILPASQLPAPPAAPAPAPPPELKETGETVKPGRIVESQNLESVKSIVSQALDEKIEPLMRMVASQQKLLLEQQMKGPSIAEIVGGIGWILGIVGISAYFMGRNRKER